MPGMHAMSGGVPAAHAPLLPAWLATAWALVFVASALFHCRHAAVTRDRARLWHGGHILIAAGMVSMYAPSSALHVAIGGSGWESVFGYATVIVLGWLTAERIRGRRTDLLWVMTLVDLGAMTYMWHAAGDLGLATSALAVYFTIQAGLWLTNAFDRFPGRAQTVYAFRYADPGVTASRTGASGSAFVLTAGMVRSSMIAMSLGMAWMFLAMQVTH